MRLVSFDGGFGRLTGASVVPMGTDLVDYLAGREDAVDGEPIAVDACRLDAPVPRPGKVICIGFNYRDHAHEAAFEIPAEPPLFSKFADSVIGPGATVRVPPQTAQADYEAELAVVIGRTASGVDVDDALAYVAGYTCANDVSARDLQTRNLQWLRGKAIETFLPMGPALVTADELPDPQSLPIRTVLNGEVMQDSNTEMMIWSVAELIAFITTTITLQPGDVISTGTPHGVGVARDPQRFLADGDEMTIEIEGVGSLTNPVRQA